jgi:hypothetical protein
VSLDDAPTDTVADDVERAVADVLANAERTVALTPFQRLTLEPYRQNVLRAQEELGRALGLLIAGAGVDLRTHTAKLSDDGAAVTVQPREAPDGAAP